MNHDLVPINLADRPVLASRRLLLRSPCKADAEAIWKLASDWEVVRRLARLPHPYTLDDARFFLEEVVPRELVWIVQHYEAGMTLGIAGLSPCEDGSKAELGYWLGRQSWGQGFATEAANVVLDYAFDAGSLTQVISGCFTDNLRSARVLEKLGFRITGQSVRRCLAEGRDLPHYDMVLTRQERLSLDHRRWQPIKHNSP